MLRAMGKYVFWPHSLQPSPRRRHAGPWPILAHVILKYPGRLLLLALLVMSPFAVVGSRIDVTYDLLSELEPFRPSKVGTQMMRDHFDVGETGPLVVLAKTRGTSVDEPAGKTGLAEMTELLYVPGVQSVRSLAEPRGDLPSGFSLKKAALQSHVLTRSLYVSQRPELGGDVTRFDVILQHNPFSPEAIEVLRQIQSRIATERTRPDSFWNNADFYFGGTTPAIADLRSVTRRDHVRIQVLVVLGVLMVLLVILRRPVICLYLILSVLFSYYVTIGLTEWTFQWLYGTTFSGLDWKVPLFLFVILVAIGQDYNIYLVTRVLEEQRVHGPFAGLRRAVVRTGGIITSCGVIMAGTFVSMTTGSLRGMIELGFALSLGVLLDTFVVRTILVPAFLTLLLRRRERWPGIHRWLAPIRPSASPPGTLEKR